MGDASGNDGEGASRSNATAMYFAPGTWVRRHECDSEKTGASLVSNFVAVVAGAFTCVPDGKATRRSRFTPSLLASRTAFIVGEGAGISDLV